MHYGIRRIHTFDGRRWAFLLPIDGAFTRRSDTRFHRWYWQLILWPFHTTKIRIGRKRALAVTLTRIFDEESLDF